MRQGRIEREQRLLAKRQEEAANFLQRKLKAIHAKKKLHTDLTVVQQVPKIVAEILALIKLKASDNQ